MTMTFPDWWDGGFPDIELTVRELLLPFVAQIDPTPDVVAWLPDDYEDHLPIVSIARMPGEASEDVLEDNPQVLVSCIGKSRAESWELSEFVRQLLLSYARGTQRVHFSDGRSALVTGVRETEGPMLSPLSNMDERVTTTTFLISTKRGNVDYSRVRTRFTS